MIYMDNAATTAPRREVCEAMFAYLVSDYGNPSGVYRLSEYAKNAVEEARNTIADVIGADRNEIFFTSGGTESDNWAVKAEGLSYLKETLASTGTERNYAEIDEKSADFDDIRAGTDENSAGVDRDRSKTAGNIAGRGRIIYSAIEHHAVTESARWLENFGIEAVAAPVVENGIVNLDRLERLMTDDTFLVSVMLVNNEVGTIQPVRKMCEIAHARGIKVHTDAVAAFGHVPVDVEELGVDYLSVSGHKICGPKGTGFLYARGGNPPQYMHGGGQEAGRRAGTENVAGIAGLAVAVRIAAETLGDRNRQEKRISSYMTKRILQEIPYSRLNGDGTKRVPGNMNFSFQYVNGGVLAVVLGKQGICASTGSACTSGLGKPSHVLLSMGLDSELAESSLRLTINHTITHREADYVVECIKKDVTRLRELV